MGQLAAEFAPRCLLSHILYLGSVRVDGLMSTLLPRSPLTQHFRAEHTPRLGKVLFPGEHSPD